MSSIQMLIILMFSFSMLFAAHTDPPKMMEDVERRFRVPAGQSIFRLICPVISEQDGRQIIVDWKKNDDQVDSDHRVKLGRDNRELRIKNVRIEDSGRYTCQATNGFGHKSLDFTVLVYELNEKDSSHRNKLILANKTSPPSWLVNMDLESNSVHILRGRRLKLRCPAQGSPLPQIRWYKDKVLISMAIQPEEASYIVESVGKGDSGDYRCVVENDHGMIENVFRVHVDEDFSRIRGMNTNRDVIIDISHNMSIKVGHTAQFFCKTKTTDSPLIRWLKEIEDPIAFNRKNPNATLLTAGGMHLQVLEQNQIESITKDIPNGVVTNRLIIPSVSTSQSGRYLCVVTTVKGNIIYQATHLTVLPIFDFMDGSISSEILLTVIFGVSALFLLLVVYAIIFLKRSQKPSSPSILKPPPPPCIPPPMTPPLIANNYIRKHDDGMDNISSMKPYSSTLRCHYMIISYSILLL